MPRSFSLVTTALIALSLGTTSPTQMLPFTQVAKADEIKRPRFLDGAATLKDLTVRVEITKLESAELEKIGRDFSTIYRLKHLLLSYRQPDQIRLEGNSRVYGDGVLILSGTKRAYTVSKLHLKKLEDLKASPAKRQSLLEFAGLMTEGTLEFLKPKFVKHEGDLDVYELRYFQNAQSPEVEKNSYFVVAIDPKTQITRTRRWFNSEGQLKASFAYLGEKEMTPGLWMPERCEIRNADNALAAVMEYRDAKANAGLSDDLFKIQ